MDKLLFKISKRIGVLGRIRNNLAADPANKVYQSLVLPVMDYCDVAWSSIGIIKWLPLSMRRDMHTINLTFKCLKGSPPMFLKIILSFLEQSTTGGE